MLLEARLEWLPREREWLTKAGILVPLSDVHAHSKNNYTIKIGMQNFIIDGHRLCNADEVPFTIDWDRKQLIVRGERVSLRPSVLKFLTKYKMGTVLIFMTPCGPEMVVLIFQDGEKGVRQKLQNLTGSDSSCVVCTSNSAGCINTKVWEWSLECLARRTRKKRGHQKGTSTGQKWRFPYVVYVDNHNSHLNKRVARQALEKYGIAIRPLIANTSHVMQPVDQNYGILYKQMFKKDVLWICNDLERMASMNCLVKFDRQKWRELCVRVLTQIASKVYLLCAQSEIYRNLVYD